MQPFRILDKLKFIFQAGYFSNVISQDFWVYPGDFIAFEPSGKIALRYFFKTNI